MLLKVKSTKKVITSMFFFFFLDKGDLTRSIGLEAIFFRSEAHFFEVKRTSYEEIKEKGKRA